MTSQTSRSIRSQSSASWLTNAMLTLRKTFSSSLASSAASGEESGSTWSLISPSSAAARFVAAGVVAPTRRGTFLDAEAGSPGLTRSGANARSKSVPATSPERSSSRRNGPVVVPGKVVDWRMTSWPARRCSRIIDAADRTGARSGSFDFVIGVGTQTMMTSASARPASSGATTRSPLPSAATSRSSAMSSIGELPPASWATRTALASTPSTRRPASTNEIARGSPTYPRPMTASLESLTDPPSLRTRRRGAGHERPVERIARPAPCASLRTARGSRTAPRAGPTRSPSSSARARPPGSARRRSARSLVGRVEQSADRAPRSRPASSGSQTAPSGPSGSSMHDRADLREVAGDDRDARREALEELVRRAASDG